MSTSGWVRVVAGLRLVASAAASQSAQQANVAASRAAQHGVDLAANARTAVMAAETLLQQQQQRMPETTMTVNAQNTRRTDTMSSTMKEEEDVSMLRRHTSNNDDMLSETAAKMEATTSILHEEARSERQSTGTTREDNNVHDGTNDEGSRTYTNNDSSVDKACMDSTTEKTSSHSTEDDGTTTTRVHHEQQQHEEVSDGRYERLQEGQAVPSTRLGRAVGFASLGVGLAFGTVAELTSRLLLKSTTTTTSDNSSSSVVATDANADRLAASLCRMRGAALKLGQMLSIQDETLLPPALSRALRQVRQGANAMPNHQLLSQLETQLGLHWRSLVDTFEEVPFAAASIGQVHRATIENKSNDKTQKKVVMKVQYPGVANSIESDLSNLQMLVTLTGLAPPGLFIEEVMRVGRNELKMECDYLSEMENQRTFKRLIESDPVLRRERFVVPDVIEELTTSQILTSEYAPGGTIDKVSHLDQEERNRIARHILRLTMQELFVWRFMQTDPNWGNFLYDVGTRTTYLIDFGAAREYSKSFVDGYLRIVWAAANRDADTIMSQSHKMGFLTGEENDIMLEAHKMSGFTVGEPFHLKEEPFDFRGSNISSRISQHSSAFLQHRLTPPPEEVYTLHRKLAGAYMLCIKLGAVINCRDLLEEVVSNHTFDDGAASPVEDVDIANLQHA